MLQHYVVQADVSASSWLAPRLSTPPYRTVDGLLPNGYQSYVRLLHPAWDAAHQPLRWADVASATGQRMHALVQWSALVGAPWQTGQEPEQGNAPWEVLGPLAEHLIRATADADDVWLCLWEGWGWLHGSPAVSHFGSNDLIPPALGHELMAMPRVRLPWRDYLLFRGPLSELARWGHYPMPSQHPDWFLTQSPSLIWPHDRNWCVATEIDHESTFVGGPETLIEALIADPLLEAWRVEASDALAAGG
jgi:hypothetical protein